MKYTVHIYKKRISRKVSAFWIAQRTCNAIPIGVPTTIEGFKSNGKVTRARTTDIYDAEVSNAS